ncbi:SDR family oxidoreductase [Sphingobium sp. HBC34]|uniref:SDR family oxidoreductase n=1 Tax=Sphingobium cyanobacteriorum TaxID=3063954 RepID=A0ABT8ZRU3_9SPHN|nr:SDR family oxidoreductase [Sphingobium sp. HBC34]MDO7836440.1 SDR family oxidoreductase [Sphingobium sp. HBC34]
MSVSFDLSGRIAMVTGGGTGLGRGIAQALIDAGAAKVYIVSRKLQVLEQAAAEMSPEGNCVAIAADLSTVAGCQQLAAEFRKREKRLDILVNNSGLGWVGSFEEYSEKGWDKSFQINLKAPFFLVQALLGSLTARTGRDQPASIINVGSIAGEMAKGGGAFAYGLAKGAVHHATRMLALELGPRNITVNAIAPGRFTTSMTTQIAQDTERLERESKMIPLGRWGRVEELGGVAVLLASTAGSYINGAVIVVDGGLMLQHPLALGLE